MVIVLLFIDRAVCGQAVGWDCVRRSPGQILRSAESFHIWALVPGP